MKISFLGDISLNGVYEEMYLNGDKPFENVSRILKDRIVIGNVECFARGNFGVNEFKKPRLETSIETLNYLKDINLHIACLANNHVYDHLEDGFQKTERFLTKNGIRKIGASIDNREYKEPLIIEENGIKVGILNYVTEDTNPNPPKDIKIKLNWFELERVINEIKQLKDKVNHIVLSLHWGGRVEGGLFPDWDQPKIAKKLIDAGAALIIGHHSHTVQPYEVYKGKYIFYSLGNFCFSDFIFEGDSYYMPKRRKYAQVVNVKFLKNSYIISTNYYYNNGNNLISNNRYSKRIKLRNKIYKHFFRIKIYWNLYYFSHRKVMPLVFYFGRNDISFTNKIKRLSIYKLKKYIVK